METVENNDFFSRLVASLPRGTRVLFERGDLGFDYDYGLRLEREADGSISSQSVKIDSRAGVPEKVLEMAAEKVNDILGSMPHYFVGLEYREPH